MTPGSFACRRRSHQRQGVSLRYNGRKQGFWEGKAVSNRLLAFRALLVRSARLPAYRRISLRIRDRNITTEDTRSLQLIAC